MTTDDKLRWDETRCKEGLAHLENLQNQVDEVRLSIPRIIQTLLGNHPMPQDLYWNFRETVTDVRKRLGDFETSWNGGQTREILEHARQSREAKMDLRNGYVGGGSSGSGGSGSNNGGNGGGNGGIGLGYGLGAEESSDWREEGGDEGRRKKMMKMMQMNNGVEKSDQGGVVVERFDGGGNVESQAQINEAVGRLKELHPDFKIDIDEENKNIKIKYKANTLPMSFTIQYELEQSGSYTFSPQCSGDMKLFPAITRCLSSRPRPYDLNYLLDMIAAYTNVKITPCAKCKKYINRNGITPAARRLKDIEASDQAKSEDWEAYHEECL